MAAETTETRRGAIARATVKASIGERRDLAWDMVRVYLGFALVLKGFVYMFHHGALAATMVQTGVPLGGQGLAEAVAVVHIMGGLMMTFGLLARIGAAIQIPNMLGALFFVHLQEGLFTDAQTLEFTLLVLFLLSVIAVVGAGPLSIDGAFNEERPRLPEELPSVLLPAPNVPRAVFSVGAERSFRPAPRLRRSPRARALRP
jgi:putative oxidoreductase